MQEREREREMLQKLRYGLGSSFSTCCKGGIVSEGMHGIVR